MAIPLHLTLYMRRQKRRSGSLEGSSSGAGDEAGAGDEVEDPMDFIPSAEEVRIITGLEQGTVLPMLPDGPKNAPGSRKEQDRLQDWIVMGDVAGRASRASEPLPCCGVVSLSASLTPLL